MKILVVTDRAPTREMIASAYELIGDAVLEFEPDLVQAQRRLKRNGVTFDQVVVEIAPSRGGKASDVIYALERLSVVPKIVILPDDASRNLARRMHSVGVAATCHWSLGVAGLVHILSLVNMGAEIFARPDGLFNKPKELPTRLSERELEVLGGICAGLQNKEIAAGFKIKEVTVKMHVRAIIKKLDAKNRTHAAMIAREMGLVQ